jgi:ribosome maturation factor RimP
VRKVGLVPTFYFADRKMDLGFAEARVREIAKETAEKGGFEFVRSEIAGTKRSPVVRIFIDKADGLTVEHCADVSREIEARLEAEDLIPSKYVLEVSSPGLERELYSLDDFRRFSGKLVKVKTGTEINGSKMHIGRIDSVDGDDVRLTVNDGKFIEIPFAAITKTNLKIELNEEFRKR